MVDIPGISSGGDMSISTGAGGDDKLGTGNTWETGGDNTRGGDDYSSVKNVNFQFKVGDAGSNALDMAAGFFKNTQPKSAPIIDTQAKTKQIAIYAAAAVAVSFALALVIRGRK